MLVALPVVTPLDLPSGVRPAAAQAGSSHLFLKLDGIQGSATYKGHENQIELDSYSLAAANVGGAVAGGGAGAGKAKVEGFTIAKQLDASSTALFDRVLKGQHVKSATLTVRSGGQPSNVLVTYELTDVVFTRYEVASKDPVPHESLSLSFGAITTKVNVFGKDGKVAATTTSSYNVAQGK